jgi:hypothetical protein
MLNGLLLLQIGFNSCLQLLVAISLECFCECWWKKNWSKIYFLKHQKIYCSIIGLGTILTRFQQGLAKPDLYAYQPVFYYKIFKKAYTLIWLVILAG